MLSASHLINDIRNIASSGSNPIEFRIEDEQILFWCNEVRAMLISQALNKRDDLNDTWLQTIHCLELEQVDSAECCTVESNCMILRSVERLPETIDTFRDNWIVSVTTPLGDIVPKMNRFKARYAKYNQFTKSSWGWYLQDGYLYVVNEQMLTLVNVTGLWSDPSELEDFVNCDDEECWTLDSPYPASLNMAKQITDIVLQTRVYPFMSLMQDTKNDGKDETLLSGKPSK